MSNETQEIIKRIIALKREEDRKFLEATERYVRINDKGAVHDAGEHGYASTVLAKLLIEFAD